MEPCRRRQIWAAQAAVTNAVQPEISHEQQNEIVQSADDNAKRHEANDANAKEKRDETHADAQGHEEVSKYACPKCGKEYRRGMFFHKKYCRGS